MASSQDTANPLFQMMKHMTRDQLALIERLLEDEVRRLEQQIAATEAKLAAIQGRPAKALPKRRGKLLPFPTQPQPVA